MADVHSLLCFRLFTSGDATGALTLYSRTMDGFTSLDIDHGVALAAQIALAFQTSETESCLHAGIASRTVIGQAVGMVMERYTLNADGAFRVLVRLSSELEIKLVDVARELIATRILPSADTQR